jgi:hypothetical protein
MSSDTRPTTVVSHAPRFSISPASERLSRSQGFLDGVLSLAYRAEHPIGDRPQPGSVLFDRCASHSRHISPSHRVIALDG